jgi:hypothetical protein
LLDSFAPEILKIELGANGIASGSMSGAQFELR